MSANANDWNDPDLWEDPIDGPEPQEVTDMFDEMFDEGDTDARHEPVGTQPKPKEGDQVIEQGNGVRR